MNLVISTKQNKTEENPLASSYNIVQQTRNLKQPMLNYEYGHIYQTNQTERKSLGVKL